MTEGVKRKGREVERSTHVYVEERNSATEISKARDLSQHGREEGERRYKTRGGEDPGNKGRRGQRGEIAK